MSTYYKPGTWNAICAVCGFQYKADQLKERWDGVKVCQKDWEPRHVLDFFKVAPDQSQTVPWSQPDDGLGGLTTTTLSAGYTTISASLTDLVYKYTGTTKTNGVTLPAANDTSFKGIPVVYVLCVPSTDTQDLNVNSAGGSAFQGRQSVSPDSEGYFRSIPAQNTWIRDR